MSTLKEAIHLVMNILEDASFGHYYFEIALLLRESMLINGTTTNAEISHKVIPKNLIIWTNCSLEDC